MSKFKSPAPDGNDIAAAMYALCVDLSLSVRQTIHPLMRDRLRIVTEVYREIEDVKIGIAHVVREWDPAGLPLPAALLADLHKVYWQASDLAHAGHTGPYKGGKR